MPRWRLHASLLAVSLLVLAASAWGAPSKLDPRARVALAQIRAQNQIGQMRERAAAVNADGTLDVFIVGEVTRQQLESLGARVRTQAGNVFTADVPASSIEAIAALPTVSAIRGASPVDLENDQSVPTTNANNLRSAGPAFTGLAGNGVILADVDTGVDYDHDDFKNPDGTTRLVNIWDQTDAVGPNPAGFPYGSEWNSADINAHTAREVDTNGHGTHVLGSAGGDGSGTGGAIPAFTYTGMAPKADLIMVKTDLTTTHILDGVAYVFARATALGKNAVCNLSLGSHYGPHDGTSAFESGLSAMTGPGRIITKSAGNERGVAQHAEIFAAGGGTNATMSVSGSSTGRLFAIDGYYEATEDLSVQITTPNGTIIGPIALGAANAAYPGTVTGNGLVYLENGMSLTATGDREVYIEVNVQSGQSMNGTWTYRFIPVTLGAANGEVDLWRYFQSSGVAANFVLGNQNNEELISEPGNADALITTAAWVSKQNWTDCGGRSVTFTGTPAPGPIASFSSPGPTRDGRQKPDIAAPGIAIGSCTTFDVARSCPATVTTLLNDNMQHIMNAGTSMAAPHTAGAAAIILQKYGAWTPAQVKAFLNARAKLDGFTGAVWNKDFGNGKLYLGDMVDPVVNVVAPNGGETYYIGTSATLQWSATDGGGPGSGVVAVDLLLSRSGPAGPFETIATGAPNTGSYNWTVTGPGTNNAYLKVVATDAAGNQGQDLSDQYFAIQDLATATLLSRFEANPMADGVALRWQFTDPAAFSDVRVERATAVDGPWTRIAVERSEELGVQVAIDRDVEAGATYQYRLVAARNGEPMTFGPITGTAGEAIREFALARIQPNPTAGAARIEYAVPREARVHVGILDVQGREVAVLADGLHRAGRYQATWSGEIGGHRAPGGMYFVRFRTPDGDYTRRVAVAR